MLAFRWRRRRCPPARAQPWWSWAACAPRTARGDRRPAKRRSYKPTLWVLISTKYTWVKGKVNLEKSNVSKLTRFCLYRETPTFYRFVFCYVNLLRHILIFSIIFTTSKDVYNKKRYCSKGNVSQSYRYLSFVCLIE